LYVRVGEYKGERLIDLGIEEFINGKVHMYAISVVCPLSIWPEVWDYYERLLRAGFERYRQEKLTYPWWEHVP